MRILILALSICSCQAAGENCRHPLLENGFLVPNLDIYEHGVTVPYGCDTGFKPALKTWWGLITCTDGTWSHTPQCIDETPCPIPHVPNAEPVTELQASYPAGTKVAFRCNRAYEFTRGRSEAECLDGNWKVPECKLKPSSCLPPPRVMNGMIKQPYKDAFEHNERLDYACAKGYKLKDYEQNTCYLGDWDYTIECVKITCRAPVVQNAERVNAAENSYNIGDRVEFRCRSSYEFEDNLKFAECVDGSWRLPVCKPRGQSRCNAPSVANAVALESLASRYSTKESVQFKCNTGYEFEGSSYAVCERGQWKLPVCKKRSAIGGRGGPETDELTSSVSDCGSLPLIENGDVTELRRGTELKVLCKALHKLVGPENVRCDDGRWTELPVCKPPCKLDRRRFLPSYPDEYLQEGEQKSFYCDPYSYNTVKISCFNGQLTHSECKYYS